MWLRRHLSGFTSTAVGAGRVDAWRFGAAAWVLAPVVEASLALTGLDKTLSMLERLPVRDERREGALAADEAQVIVSRAFRAHVGLRGLCLEKALVQWAVHRLDGTPARFVIGIRRDAEADAEVQAHAWVEAPTATEPVGVSEGASEPDPGEPGLASTTGDRAKYLELLRRERAA
jgi:Transglutaminase-like superfamily